MKHRAFTLALALLAIGALVLSADAGGTRKSGKIPVTTKSEKALEYYLTGRDLFDKLRFQESIEYFEKAIAEDPDFAVAYLSLAQVVPSTAGFFANLEKAKALADKVSPGERLWILGVEAGANALPLRQRDYYKKLVAAYPDDERAHNMLATSYFAMQDYFLAIDEYIKATEIAPDFSPPYNQLGYSRRYLGDYAGAEKAFKQYIQLIPDDPNPYDSYAELLMKMGKYDQSIEFYRKALAVNPNFVASHIGIANNLMFKGQYDAARAQLDSIYAIARNDGERRAVHFAKTVTYVDQGEMQKALDEVQAQYTLAQKINDSGAMANDLATMGAILLEWGKYDEAAAKYQQSLDAVKGSDLSDEIKENSELNSVYVRGTLALKRGDLAEARIKAREYIRGAEAARNPNQIRLAHQLAGMIALEAQDYEKALKELAKASQQDPYNLYRMALAYKGAGDRAKAREFCEAAATFNALNSLTYAFARNKARQLLQSL